MTVTPTSPATPPTPSRLSTTATTAPPPSAPALTSGALWKVQLWPGLPRMPALRRNDSTAYLKVFLVLLFVLPSGLVFGPLGAAGAPASVLAMVMFFWWFNARLAPGLGVHRGPQPMRYAMYGFQVVVGLSYVAGMSRAITPEEISSSDRAILGLVAWSGILLVAADGLRSRKALTSLLRFLVGCGEFLGVLGLVQFFTGFNPVGAIVIPGLTVHRPYGELAERSDFPRVVGTASHPIEFGVVLTLILPLAMHYAWNGPASERRRRWLGVLVIGAALPMTVARSAILGAAIVLLVLLFTLEPAQRRSILKWLPVFLVALRIMVPGLLGTIRSLFANVQNDPSTLDRTADYAAVSHYIAARPILGQGIGTYLPETNRTLDNAYLGWMIEVGVVGLLALLGLVVTGVVLCFRIRARTVDAEYRSLAGALAAALLAALVTYATFDGLGFAMCTGVMFLLLGATGALWRLTTPEAVTGPISIFGTPGVRPAVRIRRVAQTSVLALVIAAPVMLLLPRGVGDYQSGGALILQGPEITAENPYLYSPSLDIPSTILQRVVQSEETRDRLRAAGHTAGYTVAAGEGSLAPYTDKVGAGSIIRVLAVSDDAAQAIGTRDAVIAELQREVTTMQAEAGGPRAQWFRSRVLVAPPAPAWLHGSSKRAYLMILLLMLFLARVLLMRDQVRRALQQPTQLVAPITGSIPIILGGRRHGRPAPE